jgi:hypothetical protein
MSAATAAALDRLQAVLDAPVTGSSIHQQVGALAEQRSHEHPPSDISVKRLAAPAEAVPETVTGEFVALISDYEEDRQANGSPRARSTRRSRRSGRPAAPSPCCSATMQRACMRSSGWSLTTAYGQTTKASGRAARSTSQTQSG